MESKLNSYRHFFLYAKGWYKQTDLMEDLKKIQSHRCMVEAEYVKPEDLYRVLPKAVKGFFTGPDKFEHFTAWLWSVGKKDIFAKEMHTLDEAFIRTCMSIMCDASVGEGKFSSGSLFIEGELGLPDPNVLPLSNP